MVIYSHIHISPEENEDFSLEMSFDNLIFPTSTMVNDVQCTNITILDDDIFEHLQVILVTIGESEPEGIKMDESLKINILDDGTYACMHFVCSV